MSSEKLDTVIEHFTARANANSPPQKYARLAAGALCWSAYQFVKLNLCSTDAGLLLGFY